MNKLIIEDLYIFSLSEKLAKKVPFKKGCNIITSDENNGNDRGKSTIMKSIYYTLGADSLFTTDWDSDSKIYILRFNINENKYYILRDKTIFKLYDLSYNKIFSTKNRIELAKFFKEEFGFYTFLPNRKTKEFEVTPPAFNFLINYTDQTRMECTELKSFDNLSQYKNYKSYILWEYMGLYDEEYFEIRIKKDELENQNKELNKEIELKTNFVNQIDKNINNIDYSVNYESLLIDLEESKDEYIKISKKLSSLKKNLIKFRNEKENILVKIKEINKIKKDKEKNHEKEKTYDYFNEIGNYILLKNDLDNSIIELDRAIKLEEQKYIKELNILKNYEEKLNINKKEINNVIEYKGMICLRDSFIKEKDNKYRKIKSNKKLLTPINKKLQKDKEEMQKINKRYYDLMKNDIVNLNLDNVIKDESIKDILNKFKVGGSNIPLATIMYYMNMLQLKYEFNKEAFIFPVVIDSPNNTESDKEKEQMLYNYIFSKINDDTQYIISGIGIKQSNYKNIKFSNIIKLENKKYQLLNREDYIDNFWLLNELLN